MKSKSYPQFAIISETSASALTERLNETLRAIDSEDVTVEFEGLIARIRYTVTEKDIPEGLADEYALKGVRLQCDDCPYFQRARKRDGTPDYRKKVGGCPFKDGGVAFRDSSACGILYEAINNKEVRLVNAEEE